MFSAAVPLNRLAESRCEPRSPGGPVAEPPRIRLTSRMVSPGCARLEALELLEQGKPGLRAAIATPASTPASGRDKPGLLAAGVPEPWLIVLQGSKPGLPLHLVLDQLTLFDALAVDTV